MIEQVVRSFAIAIALSCTGCGLLYDFDPPDDQPMDAGPRDAGARDAGSMEDAGMAEDAGAPDDAQMSEDAGLGEDAQISIDAGVADGGPAACTSSSDCGGGSYCARPFGICYGIGTCQPLNAGPCPEIYDPVCGCDWVVYENQCGAASAGVGVMQHDSTCPTINLGGWCPTPATGSDPGGCPLCLDDDDCTGDLAPICVSSSCASGTPGICALGPLAIGYCYDARQCDLGERCIGAVLDVCPPTQGRCIVP